MALNILPRFQLPAKQMFVINRFFLRYVMGYIEQDADDGAGSNTWVNGILASGSAGQTSTGTPNTFSDAANLFSVSHIGKYLVTYGSVNIANNGVWKIVACPNASTVVLAATSYGPRFLTDLGIDWFVIDPANTLQVGAAAYTVLQAPAPAGTTPAWQVRFTCQVADTTLYRFQVAPIGGWNTSTHTFPGGTPLTPEKQFDQDASPTWYLFADSTHIFGFTENAAATGVFDAMYAGAAQPFRASVDPSFAIAAAGIPNVLSTGLFGTLQGLGTDNTTIVDFTTLKVTDRFQSPPPDDDDSLFKALTSSAFDLRRDVASIPICSSAAVLLPELRGVFRAFRYCSDSIPYRTFVGNNRGLISLGDGICCDWNGGLVI